MDGYHQYSFSCNASSLTAYYARQTAKQAEFMEITFYLALYEKVPLIERNVMELDSIRKQVSKAKKKLKDGEQQSKPRWKLW